MCKKENVDKVYFHLFMDGRDTSPYSGEKYIRLLENKMQKLGIGKVATISGRYYAMDRDNNYERIKLAYKAMVNGVGECYNTAMEAWGENQKKDITDEFIIPAVVNKDGLIKEHDGIIFANFRPDRVRELGASLTNPDFNGFFPKYSYSNFNFSATVFTFSFLFEFDNIYNLIPSCFKFSAH